MSGIMARFHALPTGAKVAVIVAGAVGLLYVKRLFTPSSSGAGTGTQLVPGGPTASSLLGQSTAWGLPTGGSPINITVTPPSATGPVSPGVPATGGDQAGTPAPGGVPTSPSAGNPVPAGGTGYAWSPSPVSPPSVPMQSDPSTPSIPVAAPSVPVPAPIATQPFVPTFDYSPAPTMPPGSYWTPGPPAPPTIAPPPPAPNPGVYGIGSAAPPPPPSAPYIPPGAGPSAPVGPPLPPYIPPGAMPGGGPFAGAGVLGGGFGVVASANPTRGFTGAAGLIPQPLKGVASASQPPSPQPVGGGDAYLGGV